MEFGDELILEGFKVPWIIWIQLIVMFLLVILLFFGATLLTSDDSASAPLSHVVSDSPTNSNHVNSIVKDEDDMAENRGREECLDTQENREEDESPSSSKDSVVLQFFRGQIHPCSYMRAIFRCFGLDSSSENSRNPRHGKQE